MNINERSNISDILEAIQGSWDYYKDSSTSWVCYEMGKIKIWRKLCQKGKNVLPDKYLKDRESVTPYLKFAKDSVTGGCITLQQQYIDLDSSAVIVILDL